VRWHSTNLPPSIPWVRMPKWVREWISPRERPIAVRVRNRRDAGGGCEDAVDYAPFLFSCKEHDNTRRGLPSAPRPGAIGHHGPRTQPHSPVAGLLVRPDSAVRPHGNRIPAARQHSGHRTCGEFRFWAALSPWIPQSGGPGDPIGPLMGVDVGGGASAADIRPAEKKKKKKKKTSRSSTNCRPRGRLSLGLVAKRWGVPEALSGQRRRAEPPPATP